MVRTASSNLKEQQMPVIWRYGAVLVITLFTFCYEVWGSYTTHSKGILSDAIHMLGDGIPFLLGFLAEHSRTSAERKAQLAKRITQFNFLFLAITSVFMFTVGLLRLQSPVPIHDEVLYFAVIGIAGNAAQLFLAHGFERSQMLHLLADLIASIGVVVGSVLVVYFGLVRADSVATLLVAMVTAWAASECFKGGHTHAHTHGHEDHNHHGHHH